MGGLPPDGVVKAFGVLRGGNEEGADQRLGSSAWCRKSAVHVAKVELSVSEGSAWS